MQDINNTFLSFGTYAAFVSDKRPEWADKYEEITNKYISRIKGSNDLLRYFLKMMNEKDQEINSIFISPYDYESELDTKYTDLIPLCSCHAFIKRYEENDSEHSRENLEEYNEIVINNYDFFKEYIVAKYQEAKANFISQINKNGEIVVESEEEYQGIGLEIYKVNESKLEFKFPNVAFIKQLDFKAFSLEKIKELELNKDSAPKTEEASTYLFYLNIFNTIFNKSSLLIYTELKLEAKLLTDEIAFFYKSILLFSWFYQNIFEYFYNLGCYSLIIDIFKKNQHYLSYNTIMTNQPSVLLAVAYYYESRLKIDENLTETKTEIINYYEHLYQIYLFIKTGLQYSSDARTEKMEKLFLADKNLLLPKHKKTIDDKLKSPTDNSIKSKFSLRTLDNKSIKIDSIESVLKQIVSLFSKTFMDETMIDFVNRTMTEKFEENLEHKKEKLELKSELAEKEKLIKRYEPAYTLLQDRFMRLKKAKLPENLLNLQLDELLDDISFDNDIMSFEDISLEEIEEDIWNSFSPKTVEALKSSFTMINYAKIPVDLAVLNILRCIEMEFVPHILLPFKNKYYLKKEIPFFYPSDKSSKESQVHNSIYYGIKDERFMLGEIEKIGDYLSYTPDEKINSPLIRDFKKYLGSKISTFCLLCIKLKSCNEYGDTEFTCSDKFIDTKKPLSIKELRNIIAHGNKDIEKINKETFKKIYYSLVKKPLEILVGIIKVSKQINR